MSFSFSENLSGRMRHDPAVASRSLESISPAPWVAAASCLHAIGLESKWG